MADISRYYILNAVGIDTIGARAFNKKYPDAGRLYSDIYNALDDEQIKSKFVSRNREEAAAAIVASKRMAEENRSLTNTRNGHGKQQQKVIANAKFKAHYLAALKDIQKNQLDISDPVALAAFNKKSIKKDKSPTPQPRLAAHTVVQLCNRELKCELQSFKIDINKSSEDDPLAVVLDFSPRSGQTQAHLNKPIVIDKDSGKISIDLFSDKCPAEVHVISGKLKYYRSVATITSAGSCDHGKANICPTVKVICDHTKFAKAVTRPLGTHTLEEGHGDKAFKKLHLMPRTRKKLGDWQSLVAILKSDTSALNPASYHVSARSHRPGAPFTGYQTLLQVYPFTLIAFTAAVTLGKEPSVKVSALARLDDQDINIEHSDSPIEFLKTLTEHSWLLTSLGALNLLVKGFSLLNRGVDDEVVDIDAGIDGQSLEEAHVADDENTDAALQPVQLNLAYRRILKTLPNANGVGFYEEVFLSGSPLLKYQKSVNLINLLCKSSLSAMTMGASTLASQWGVTEFLLDSFNNAKTLFRQIANNIAQQFVSDEDIPAVLCGEASAEGDAEVTTKVACTLAINVAVENDNPGAGLVWSREPNEPWQFDRSSTSIYGGGNFQLTGSINSDLKILKTIGFGSGIDSAGVNLNIQSADATGEVRLAVNLSADPNKQYRAHKTFTQDGQPNNAVAKDELDGATGEAPQSSPFACSFSVLFSGIGVYLEAFIVVAEKSAETEDQEDISHASSNSGIEDEFTDDEFTDDEFTDDDIDIGKELKKRISFQVMKARASKAKTWVLPFDKIIK